RRYVCKYEGCGKCFLRGEHLKRHIRRLHVLQASLAYKCLKKGCLRSFSRKDNLKQHMSI
ncbi:uncharacterized protein BT62DRAFT_875965, partial [Guyanagaster necrorhizus]